jgi:hypothetical protein
MTTRIHAAGKNNKQRPMMVSFAHTSRELHGMGLVAWGGYCLDMQDLRSRDLAARLGASALWLETLFEAMAQIQPTRLVLVDPDFSIFLGDEEENMDLLQGWLKQRKIPWTLIHTQAKKNKKRVAA